MKFLLVSRYSEVEPLGVAYLSAALKKAGHTCQLYLYNPSSFTNFELSAKVKTIKPDVVGFSTYTGEHRRIYNFCDLLRDKGIKTAIGGAHTLYYHEECRNHADYVFVGEALVSLPKLDDYTFYPLVDVKDIPHPDRKELYATSKFHKQNPIKNIMCSFGCPYSCSYCYNSLYKEHYKTNKVRLREVDDVIDEAKEVDADLIFFQDDCFGFSMKWLEEFARKWNRPYHCQLRFELATDDRLKLLKQSGCTGITCAIESANQDIRTRLLNRKVTDNQIIKGIERIKKYGLKLRTEQMLGIPETTIEDDLNLLKLNVEMKPTIAWASIFQPYLGTPLGNYCVEKRYYQKEGSDIGEDFFGRSVLNWKDNRAEKLTILQKIFSLCSHIPEGQELARKVLEGSPFPAYYVDETTKKHLYGVLYG